MLVVFLIGAHVLEVYTSLKLFPLTIHFSGIGAAVVAILYGHFYDTEDQVMTDPGAIPLPDLITLIILAALGLLGFLLLTR